MRRSHAVVLAALLAMPSELLLCDGAWGAVATGDEVSVNPVTPNGGNPLLAFKLRSGAHGFSTTLPVVAPVSRSRWASAASASGIANTAGVCT